jgi:amidase
MKPKSPRSTSQSKQDDTSEICFRTATELARLIRRKELSAREVVRAHLRRIERVNPRVNAIVTLVADRALAQAKRLDESAAKGRFAGPLHGLPIAHKDLQEVEGIRTTYGSPIFREYVPDFSTLLVERCREAGAIVIGKTNTPEFGAGSQTFNPVFGVTRNPYDLSKTCGGSSGGSAVALACGMVPIADGTDMGGSLRNPASYCSVVGFRPSPGRVPIFPNDSAWDVLNVVGPMARTVRDLALLLSVIAGPDSRAPLSIQEPGSRFARPPRRTFKGVRVAWCPAFAGLPFDRRVREIVHARRRVFQALGCVIEEVEAPDFSDADEIFRVFRALSFYRQHAGKVAQHRAQIKEAVIDEVERGARLTGSDVANAEIKRSRLSAKFGQFMERYPFLVLPTVQVPPFDVEQPFVTEIDGTQLSSYIDWMRSCYYITVTGHPAISVPAGFTPEGLPVGLQIVGRSEDDFGVLQLAHAYERETASENHRPAISGD